MSKITIEFSSKASSIKAVKKEIRRKVRAGAEDGLEETLELGVEVSRNVIKAQRNPFTSPHLKDKSSFHTGIHESHNTLEGAILNTLDYAAYVDEGVSGTQRQRNTPFAYTDTKPPVEKLVPWVQKHLTYWDIESDGDPFSGGSSSSARSDEESEPEPAGNPVGEQLGDDNLTFADDDESLDAAEEFDYRYTDDVDVYDASNLSEGDSVGFIGENGRTKRDTVTSIETDPEDEDFGYVELQLSRKFYLNKKENEDLYDNSVDDIVKPFAKGEFKTLEQVEEGDELIIDADELSDPPDGWKDSIDNPQKIFVNVKKSRYREIQVTDTSGEVSNYRIGTIDRDAIFVSRENRPEIWNLYADPDSYKGSGITYSKRDEIKSGYLSDVTTSTKRHIVPRQLKAINKDSGDVDRFEYEDILNIDESVDYFDQYQSATSFDASNTENIVGAEDDPQLYGEGGRYLVWDHRQGQLRDAVVENTYSDKTGFSIGVKDGVLGSETHIWEPGNNDSNDNPVTPLGKYPPVGSGFGNGSTVDTNGNSLLWYGQEITFEYEGKQYKEYVSGWDRDKIYLADNGVTDSIPRYPTQLQDGYIVDGQDWTELNPSEKKKQIKSEIQYRVQKNIYNRGFVDEFSTFIAENWYERMNDKELAQQTIANMVAIGDKTGFGVGGRVSGLVGLAEGEYGYQLSTSDNPSEGSFNLIPTKTAHHEMFHGVFSTVDLASRSNDFVDGFKYDEPVEFPEDFPIAAFNDDGTFDGTRFKELQNKTDVDLPNHNNLAEFLYGEEQDTALGSSRFDDVEISNQFSDFTTEDVTESDWQTGKSLSNILSLTVDNNDIEGGDLVRLEKEDNDGDIKEIRAVFEGSVSKGEGDRNWNFRKQDGNPLSVTVEDDGSVDSSWNLTGLHSPEKPDGWWEADQRDWEPSQDTPLLNLAEASNRALKRQLKTYTQDFENGEQAGYPSYRVSILRGYGSANAGEVTSALIEVMQSDSEAQADEAVSTFQQHPALVKQFLNVMEPSPVVRDKLERFDELDNYL